MREDAIIVPSGEVSKLMPLAAMLRGQGVEIRVLLDGDEPGIQKGKEIKDRLLIESFFLSSYSNGKGADIKDLFPQNVYVGAVKKAYNLTELVLSKDGNYRSIVSRVENALKKTGITNFEKWKPEQILTEWIRTAPEKFPDTVIESFERLFKDINRSWLV